MEFENESNFDTPQLYPRSSNPSSNQIKSKTTLGSQELSTKQSKNKKKKKDKLDDVKQVEN